MSNTSGGHSGQVSPIEIQHLFDLGDGIIPRYPRGRMLAGDVEGARSRIRIGAVLDPAVFLALPNRARFLQHQNRPSPQRADRRSTFLEHQPDPPAATRVQPFKPRGQVFSFMAFSLRNAGPPNGSSREEWHRNPIVWSLANAIRMFWKGPRPARVYRSVRSRSGAAQKVRPLYPRS